MPLDALTSPEAVLDAIAEYDQLGRDAFLAKYGFRPARDVVLVHDGRQYDSKPIVAAAHGYQHPETGPLRHTEFNGGYPTASKLEQLGFEVIRLSDEDSSSDDPGRLLARFLEVYENAKLQAFTTASSAAQTLKETASALEPHLPESLARATVKASVGQGNWAQVPWISVLDPRETSTTQHGVYPVLLIPQDLRGVYLTIAQGVTDLKKQHGKQRAYQELARRADVLRPQLTALSSRGFDDGASVDLGGSSLGQDYAASVVTAKFLSVANLPQSELGSDFTVLCEAYAELLERGALRNLGATRGPAVMSVYVGQGAERNFEAGGRRGWWGWRQAFPAATEVEPGDLILFGFRYTGGSPRVDATAWSQHGLGSIVVGRIDQPPSRTDQAVMPDELAGEDSYPYKVRFHVLDEISGVALNSGGGLSAGVADAIRRSAISRGAGMVQPVEGSPLLEALLDRSEPAPLAVQPLDEVVDGFVAAVEASGMVIDATLSSAFLAAAMSKPFLILTGLSGSGKTQLAMRLGEWCGVDQDNKLRYQVVPVRPDWTGPEYLFGFPDALQPRIDGQAVWAAPETLQFLLRAHRESKRPYVLILDEMNLAHVERYFADFLSGIESREPVLPDLHQRDGKWVERPGGQMLPIPRNLIVIGTVNVDETTYLFSPKVLDRAFTFEFRVSDEELDPALRRPTPIEPAEPAILESVVALLNDDGWQFEHPHADLELLADDLRDIHRILQVAGLEFGHRVMYEVLRFAAILDAARGTARDPTLDLVLMTKILPRLHGSRQRLEGALTQLLDLAGGDDGVPRLPMVKTKAERMLGVLRDVQFVSFTE